MGMRQPVSGSAAPMVGWGNRHGAGLALLVLAVFGAVALHWPGVMALSEAWSQPEYSHAVLIPFIALFLVTRSMRTAPAAAARPRGRWAGIVLVVFAIVLALLGNFARIPDVVSYALLLWIWGTALASTGIGTVRHYWAALAVIIFMMPLPSFLYWPVSMQLQLVSSRIGVEIIGMFGVPVLLDGNIIDLGIHKLAVAEACSGLRYLYPIMCVAFLFAVLQRGRVWQGVVLFLSSAPIAIALNAIRVGLIGVLVDRFGVHQAEGFMHAFEGWATFVACILVLFLLAAVLQRLSGDPRPLSQTLDLGADGMLSRIGRLGAVPFSAMLGTVAMLTVTASAIWHLAPARDLETVQREPLATFPRSVGDWTGSEVRIAPEVRTILRADDYWHASYRTVGASAPIDLFIAFYADQAGGAGIHAPDICIPAAGWEIDAWSSASAPTPAGPAAFNRAVIRQGVERQVVYYWFEQRGERFASAYRSKAMTLWDSATLGRSDGALVRLVTPLLPHEPVEAADRRMQAFLASLIGDLTRFIPE